MDLWSYRTEGRGRKSQQVWKKLFWGARNIPWPPWDSVHSAPKLYILLAISALNRKISYEHTHQCFIGAWIRGCLKCLWKMSAEALSDGKGGSWWAWFKSAVSRQFHLEWNIRWMWAQSLQQSLLSTCQSLFPCPSSFSKEEGSLMDL